MICVCGTKYCRYMTGVDGGVVGFKLHTCRSWISCMFHLLMLDLCCWKECYHFFSYPYNHSPYTPYNSHFMYQSMHHHVPEAAEAVLSIWQPCQYASLAAPRSAEQQRINRSLHHNTESGPRIDPRTQHLQLPRSFPPLECCCKILHLGIHQYVCNDCPTHDRGLSTVLNPEFGGSELLLAPTLPNDVGCLFSHLVS